MAKRLDSTVFSVEIDSLTPCPANEWIFPDSTSPEKIAVIAEDLRKRGQIYPAQMATVPHPDTGIPCRMLLDGHRRFFGLLEIGAKRIDVIDRGDMSYDEVLSEIIASANSQRTRTPREDYRLYQTAHDLLQRTRGRPVGRPEINNPHGDYLSAEEIRLEAAKQAGVSPTQASRLEAIYERGSPEIQDQVTRGELSVRAAYKDVPKRPKAKATDQEQVVAANPFETSQSTPNSAAPESPADSVSTSSAEEGKEGPVDGPESASEALSESEPPKPQPKPLRASEREAAAAAAKQRTLREVVTEIIDLILDSGVQASEILGELCDYYGFETAESFPHEEETAEAETTEDQLADPEESPSDDEDLVIIEEPAYPTSATAGPKFVPRPKSERARNAVDVLSGVISGISSTDIVTQIAAHFGLGNDPEIELPDGAETKRDKVIGSLAKLDEPIRVEIINGLMLRFGLAEPEIEPHAEIADETSYDDEEDDDDE